nr:uncharacterized protein LOC113743923 [Coffea arabica]XP_027127787.1 uncharacterized protein LOC113743925 [Coffea arabica]
MADLLEQMVNQQGQGQVQHPGNHEGEDRALERFQNFLPPKFLGGPNPDIAESWLERMLDIFAALEYSEKRQIAFAVFQFEGAARAWWNERREDEFIRLRQGIMSVAEYETQFTKLSRFAPELVLTDQRKIRRFVQGLNLEIQEALAAAQLKTYSQAIEKAQRIESTKSQVS